MIRRLPLDEWSRFEKLCTREFGKAPTPTEATVVVAEEDGEMIGFACARWIVVVGPMWVRPDKRRGMSVFAALLEKLRTVTRSKTAYTWTKDVALLRLYKLLGLRSEGEALSWREHE